MASEAARPLPGAVIDSDLHATVPSVRALFPFLSEHWREQIEQTGFKGPADNPYPAWAATSALPDAKSAAGGPPGSDLATLQAQVLDPLGVEAGILNCMYGVDGVHNLDAAAALARAANDWLAAEWLERDPRLRASIVVANQHPETAAAEIERVARLHPGFVQVLLPARSAMPYGKRHFHPIYAAATRHGLAVGIHFGGAPGTPPTASGWSSYYAEDYAGMAHAMQSQVVSLVTEGVFEQFTELRVTCIEGGWTWLPSLMWRLDKDWKGLRREVPWVRRSPSEYIRDHMRFTLQPLDAPPDPAQLRQVVAQVGSDNFLLFSTDYPHRHRQTAEQGVALLDADDVALRGVLAENARAWYRLGGQADAA